MIYEIHKAVSTANLGDVSFIAFVASDFFNVEISNIDIKSTKDEYGTTIADAIYGDMINAFGKKIETIIRGSSKYKSDMMNIVVFPQGNGDLITYDELNCDIEAIKSAWHVRNGRV